MMYVLTQAELDELNKRPKLQDLAEADAATAKLREALLVASGVRCVHSTSIQDPRRVRYCTECPVGKLIRESQYRDKTLCPVANAWPK